MRLKQIIIDKDAFVGINLGALCNFAQTHFLILPAVLYDECAANEKASGTLFRRFSKIMIAGGYWCASAVDIVQKEGEMLQPYGYLPDLGKTNRMRERFKKGYRLSVPDNIADIRESQTGSAQILVDLHKRVICEVAADRFRDAAEEVNKSGVDRQQRFEKWARIVERLNIHELAVKVLAKFTGSPEKYCLSDDWVTWHHLRLATILSSEYTYLKGKPGKNQIVNAEHDLHDLAYVLLLSRADGMLTRDKKLVKPLAQAAFTDKDVFSGLDEVPEEYACNWS